MENFVKGVQFVLIIAINCAALSKASFFCYYTENKKKRNFFKTFYVAGLITSFVHFSLATNCMEASSGLIRKLNGV